MARRVRAPIRTLAVLLYTPRSRLLAEIRRNHITHAMLSELKARQNVETGFITLIKRPDVKKKKKRKKSAESFPRSDGCNLSVHVRVYVYVHVRGDIFRISIWPIVLYYLRRNCCVVEIVSGFFLNF